MLKLAFMVIFFFLGQVIFFLGEGSMIRFQKQGPFPADKNEALELLMKKSVQTYSNDVVARTGN